MSGQPSLKQRKQSVAPKKLHRRRSVSKEEAEAEWKVAAQPPPARRLTTPELGAARRMFFELDRDGSGSIESEELGIMLRSLGQNPTDDELKALIASVDGKHGGDADGKIQLREFLVLYSRGLDDKSAATDGDINDIFSSMGGDPRATDSRVQAEAVKSYLLSEFDLDVDVESAFKLGMTKELSKGDFAGLLNAS